jgi:hypothetical protein
MPIYRKRQAQDPLTQTQTTDLSISARELAEVKVEITDYAPDAPLGSATTKILIDGLNDADMTDQERIAAYRGFDPDLLVSDAQARENAVHRERSERALARKRAA